MRKIVHQYDLDRTARDGCRVLCGRFARGVKWVMGYRAVTCKACLRVMKKV
jgi:hypothetical protein